jgi:hypothetical protein
VNEISAAVEDFKDTFNTDDKTKLAKHLATVKTMAAPNWKDGLEATVVAIKANEALTGGKRVTFQQDWFELA